MKRTAPPPHHDAGFTLTELVVTMIIIGVLAAFVLPRMSGGGATAGSVFADRIVSTLLLAQKTAVTHRRTVCVTTAARALTLRIARANADTACTLALKGQLDADSATSDTDVAATSGDSLIGTTLFFLPNGDVRRVTANGVFASGTIAVQMSGRTLRTIAIEGRTGYVD